ncbi:hypothetical protein K438DRAFT_1766528 [Mycena galopus ATCC 62051]|nr:hypothetical protein K438DRAFT_1766528 [Mycena galopus ATCC 62051]
MSFTFRFIPYEPSSGSSARRTAQQPHMVEATMEDAVEMRGFGEAGVRREGSVSRGCEPTDDLMDVEQANQWILSYVRGHRASGLRHNTPVKVASTSHNAQSNTNMNSDDHVYANTNPNTIDTYDATTVPNMPGIDHTLERTSENQISQVAPQQGREALYKASNFVDATPTQKTQVIRGLIAANHLTLDKLRTTVTLHEGMTAQDRMTENKRNKTAAQLKKEFLEHSCTEACLLTTDLAKASKLDVPPLPQQTFLAAAGTLKLRLGLTVRAGGKRKRVSTDNSTDPKAKRTKTTDTNSTNETTTDNNSTDDARTGTREEPFQILTDKEKASIMEEFIEATSNSALQTLRCSFCGSRQRRENTFSIPCTHLDTTLLDNAVKVLREICSQPAIQAVDQSTISEGHYTLCTMTFKPHF